MKLWKSLKISIGNKSDPKSFSQDIPQWSGQGYELDVFKSQTSLSTDSGLCTERGLRRTHIELVKPPGKRIGLKLADRDQDSFHTSSYNYQEEVELDAYHVNRVVSEDELMPDTPGPINTDVATHAQRFTPPIEDVTEESQIQSELVQDNVQSVAIPAPSAEVEEEMVPEEIMDFLGEAKIAEEAFGKKIPQGVSERLGKILIEGLAKEQKENLLTKTLVIPENFQLVKAPKLNAEVAVVLNDPAKNRDKRLEKLQNQLGSGIAGLVNLTSELINKDLDKMDVIKKISEVNQILMDLHYEETMSRRRLVIPMLDKNFINIIQNVKRDHFLFGENLGDNIKTTKYIERSSLQIKKPVPAQSTNRKPFGQSGNMRGPARQASGPGAARAQPSTSRYYPPPPPPPPPAYRRPPATRRPPPPPPPRGHSLDYRSRRR